MSRLRAILAALICLALPWSATANMLEGMGCHHEGLGILAQPMSAMSGHEMDGRHMDHSGSPTGMSGCDCAVKCSCSHHCATSGGVAAVASALPLKWSEAPADQLFAPYEAVPRGSLLTDVFRPPNTAQS